jgi:hypothetical protein
MSSQLNDRFAAELRLTQSCLIILPSNSELPAEYATFGKQFKHKLIKVFKKEDIVYSNDLQNMKDSFGSKEIFKGKTQPDNLEVATLAKALGCSSALVLKINNIYRKNNFRLSANLWWIDADSAKTLYFQTKDFDLNYYFERRQFNNYQDQYETATGERNSRYSGFVKYCASEFARIFTFKAIPLPTNFSIY